MKHMLILSEDQIRNSHFIIPDISIQMVFGEAFFVRFQERREDTRKHGGSVQAIGWPDGTTVFLERIDLNIPFDSAYLTDYYYATKMHLNKEAK